MRRFAHLALPVITVIVVLALATPSLPGVAGQAATPGPLPHYALDVRFDPAHRTMSGAMEVDWPNLTGEPHDAIYLRLYPNGAHYPGGALETGDHYVDGKPVVATRHADPTVLRVALPRELAPGATVRLAMSFVTTVPETSDAGFGIFGGSDADGWWLASWHPVVAGWEPGEGWYLAPPTVFGDPTFANSSTWDVRLTAPAGLAVIASGVETTEPADPVSGTATTRVVSAPGREMTLTLVPDGGEIVTRAAGGVEVAVHLPAGVGLEGLGGELAGVAAAGLQVYARWLGPYHDTELDIAAIPRPGAPPVSWNGLVWLDLDAAIDDGAVDPGEWDTLRFHLLHEVAHQWLHGIVGSNNNDHGFLSEGLANTLAVLAARELYGEALAESWLRDRVAAGYLSMLETGQDGVADAPLTNATDLRDRARLVYGKAALGFEAIRQELGDEAFFAGLAAYGEAFRHGISAPEDLRGAWEAVSGRDIGVVWRHWILEADADVAEVEAVLDGFHPGSIGVLCMHSNSDRVCSSLTHTV